MNKSLDPRVKRLSLIDPEGPIKKITADQLRTYEVFVQLTEQKPLTHAGIVHSDDPELAFVFAKEQYTRRGRGCLGLCVVPTRSVWVSETSEGTASVYDKLDDIKPEGADREYQVFHLLKRGKQHEHAGSVTAHGPGQALEQAKKHLAPDQPVYNVWLIPTDELYIPEDDVSSMWDTLQDKSYREPINYRAGEKLKAFKAAQHGG